MLACACALLLVMRAGFSVHRIDCDQNARTDGKVVSPEGVLQGGREPLRAGICLLDEGRPSPDPPPGCFRALPQHRVAFKHILPCVATLSDLDST